MKNFINISDLSKNDLRSIIDGAKKRKSERGKIANSQPDVDSVSYTHLTLPTICSV